MRRIGESRPFAYSLVTSVSLHGAALLCLGAWFASPSEPQARARMVSEVRLEGPAVASVTKKPGTRPTRARAAPVRSASHAPAAPRLPRPQPFKHLRNRHLARWSPIPRNPVQKAPRKGNPPRRPNRANRVRSRFHPLPKRARARMTMTTVTGVVIAIDTADGTTGIGGNKTMTRMRAPWPHRPRSIR